ncbi:MAG: aminotransferase class I/II-fold pyridoxal phosphate-dependent enzyme [Limnochordia bacterium]
MDEAFIDFTPEGRAASAAPLVGDCERLIVVYSLTKLFAIPGLRLGCLVGPPGPNRGLAVSCSRRGASTAWPSWRDGPPWGMNPFGSGRGKATAAAAGVPLPGSPRPDRDLVPIRPPPTSFLSPSMIPSWTGTTVTDALGRRGILVRNCASFEGLEGDRHIRVAVRTQAGERASAGGSWPTC